MFRGTIQGDVSRPYSLLPKERPQFPKPQPTGTQPASTAEIFGSPIIIIIQSKVSISCVPDDELSRYSEPKDYERGATPLFWARIDVFVFLR